MNGYSTFHKSPELDPHYQMKFSVLPSNALFWEEVLAPVRGIQSAYSKPRRQSKNGEKEIISNFFSQLKVSAKYEQSNIYSRTFTSLSFSPVCLFLSPVCFLCLLSLALHVVLNSKPI